MKAAAAEPKYISRLALQSNPFKSEVSDAGLYLGPEIKQRLDLVLHLLRASDKVPFLYGPKGLGKTTTLKALMNLGGDDLRFCFIQAEPSLTIQFMVSRCLQVFGAPQENTLGSNNLQLLQQRLQQLQALQIRPVLLIDDVSKLAEPLRQQLKAWLDWQHADKHLWRAVLTDVSADAFTTDNDRLQSLMLSPIPSAETAAYLLQRLQGAGFNGDSPFNERALARFYRQSAGNPAKLNQAAHQFLLGQGKARQLQLPLSFKLPAISPKLNKIRFKWNKWFGLAPIVVLLAAILVYQQQINDWFITDKDAIQDDVLSNNDLTEELPMVIVNEPEELTSVAEADRLELLELLDELEQTVAEPAAEMTEPEPELALEFEPVMPEPELTPEILETEIIPAESITAIATTEAAQNNLAEATETETSIDEQQSIPPVEEMKPVELIPSPAPVSKPDILLVDTTIKDKDWVLQQSGKAFTFQLMGSWDNAEIERFVKKHSLTGNVAIFESMRDDKVWYALIYGVYPSRDVATRSSKQWPSPLNKVKPWLRRFDDVQKQITERAPDR
ncbi:MAG: AAA family ATPase [Gammaproteobacteria bacterium]|nr:AAA family ATPase [Gammaproteobacteria bacterium]